MSASQRWIFRFHGIVLFLLLLTGCQGNLPATPGEPETTATTAPTRAPTATSTATPVVPSGTISIWHSWQEPQLPALLRIIASFQDQYPSVVFDVLYVPEIDLKASFLSAAQENRGPTILIAPGSWGPELYKAGRVVDLSTHATPGLLALLNPAGVATGKFESAQVGLPLQMQGVVLFRNTRLIARAPATLEEMINLAKQATRSDRFGAVLERSFFFSGAHLIGLGGGWQDTDGQPAFNTDAGLEWIRILREFEEAGPPEFLSDNDINLFKEGRVGFIIDGTWNRAQFAEAIGIENLAIDPWPAHNSGVLAGFALAENIYLCPKALQEVHQVSWKFIEHALRPESMSWVAETGSIPAVAETTANTIVANIQARDLLTSQAIRALVDAVAYPPEEEMTIYQQQIDIALQSIFNNEASPAAALQSAQTAILEVLLSARLTATPSP